MALLIGAVASVSLSSSALASASALIWLKISEEAMGYVIDNPDSSLSKALIAMAFAQAKAHARAKDEDHLKNPNEVGQVLWQYDQDSNSRECKVYLVFRDLFAGFAHHCSVEFDFGGYYVTYEAGRDKNGRLKPSWNMGKTQPKGKENVSRDLVCKMKISPKQLNLTADNNIFNNKTYSLTEMNCQTWAIELLRLLHIDLALFAQILERRLSKVELIFGKHEKQVPHVTQVKHVPLLEGLFLALNKTQRLENQVLPPVEITNLASEIMKHSKEVSKCIDLLYTDPHKFFVQFSYIFSSFS